MKIVRTLPSGSHYGKRLEGIMANGRRMQDEAFTAASWDYPFGTRLIIRPSHAGPSAPVCVVVTITDRGPSRRLYQQGRLLDLSQKSFAALADLKKGVIEVTVEQVSR